MGHKLRTGQRGLAPFWRGWHRVVYGRPSLCGSQHCKGGAGVEWSEGQGPLKGPECPGDDVQTSHIGACVGGDGGGAYCRSGEHRLYGIHSPGRHRGGSQSGTPGEKGWKVCPGEGGVDVGIGGQVKTPQGDRFCQQDGWHGGEGERQQCGGVWRTPDRSG